MGIFKDFIYSIITSCNKKCLQLDQCPAVTAEMEDKPATEVCKICEKCWNKIKKKQR